MEIKTNKMKNIFLLINLTLNLSFFSQAQFDIAAANAVMDSLNKGSVALIWFPPNKSISTFN